MHAQRLLDNLDLPTIGTGLALAGLGIFSIASATIADGASGSLWRMQLIWLLVAVAAATVIVAVDYHVWAEVSLLLHATVLLLLVGVLFFGREVGGNRSWLVIGPARIQPSELAKWTTCLLLAVYLSRRGRGSLGFPQLVVMGLIVGTPMALVAAQPDMGTALIFVPIYIGALVMGGVRWKVLVGLLLVGLLLAPMAWLVLEDYQKERILTVLEPGRDPSGIGYQVQQSKIAIGSGQLLGKGLYQGTQSQLNFLPAQRTDFILSVFAEQLGFLGAVAVLGLFYHLFFRGIVAARSSQDRLGTYTCMLVVAWLAGQMAVNVGMVLGRLPTIGVPLPLVSYGGSSLVATVCGLALIVNVRSRRFVN